MVAAAISKIEAGTNFPGLILTTTNQSIRAAIEDILLIAEFMPHEEIQDRQILYLPLAAN